jgi:hypothetical protein
MATEEEAVLEATERFYRALVDLLEGKGVEPMRDCWDHGDKVSTVHPFGHWSIGWKEVSSTWDEVAAVFSLYKGHADRDDHLGSVSKLCAFVLGDVAYTTGLWTSVLYLPFGNAEMKLNCTNILRKRDGVWKIVHHHADQATEDYQQKLGRMVQEAQGG